MSFWQELRNLFKVSSEENDAQTVEAVEKTIGYTFRNSSLLLLSLTHRSYTRAKDNCHYSNERLEYLGDSVLGLIIAERLYQDHPRQREGKLTKTKAMLVNETALSTVGREIGLNQYIRLSVEEEKLGGRERASIISDAFESVIGAVYLDGGLDAARDVVLRLIYTRRQAIVSDESQRNYKGDLLELLQSRGEGMPRYDVEYEAGPDHEKEFAVGVFVASEKIGTGVGHTKKEAEQRAAAMALELLNRPSNDDDTETR